MKKYRYQVLTDHLTQLIKDEKYKPHDLLPSYAEIREEYGLSIATITRAFDNMEKRGLIYSVHGKGTFVSPPVKSRKILILYPGDGLYRDSALFLDGAQKYLFKKNRAYLPILLPLKFVLDDPENITYIYPDIKGIIVFRDFSSFVKLEAALKDLDIHFLFYGSSMHRLSREGNSYLYDEEEIARLVINHLWNRGYREAGAVPFRSKGLGQHRFELFMKAASERGVLVKDRNIYRGKLETHELMDWLKGRDRNGLPLYTSQGRNTLTLLYLILKSGLSLPGDIGLIGVDRIEQSGIQDQSPTYINLPTSLDGVNCVKSLIDLIEGRLEYICGTSPVTIVSGGTLI